MIKLKRPAKLIVTYAQALILAARAGEAAALAFYAENPHPWRHQHLECQRDRLNGFWERLPSFENEKSERITAKFRTAYRATFKRLQEEWAAGM